MNKINFFKTVTLFVTQTVLVSGLSPLVAQVRMSEEQWVIPTYRIESPDKNPMFYNSESYEGAARYVYPYFLNDVISRERADQAWKALILENEYIKLCVTPEIGGKLYYATDKIQISGYDEKHQVTGVNFNGISITGERVKTGSKYLEFGKFESDVKLK